MTTHILHLEQRGEPARTMRGMSYEQAIAAAVQYLHIKAVTDVRVTIKEETACKKPT